MNIRLGGLKQRTDYHASAIIARGICRFSIGSVLITFSINKFQQFNYLLVLQKGNKTLFALLMVLLAVSGCLPRGPADPATFDCSTDNPIYELIMQQHTQWIANFYQTGATPSTLYGDFLEDNQVSVWLVGPSGLSNELARNYDNWNNIEKMLVIETAIEFEFDGEWYGNYGSFGFIHSDVLDPASVFNYYTITRLTDTVYCYMIKPEHIQDGH